MGQSIGFNHLVFDAFFGDLNEVLRRESSLAPPNIWNLDQTGIPTVVKPNKLSTEKRVKQVARISLAERGETVTMCCYINAIGNAFPPVYIFLRVHFKSHKLKGAPAESLGLAHSSGWITTDLFAKAMKNFIKFMKVSKSNHVVLLMDKHISHLSIDVIDMA